MGENTRQNCTRQNKKKNPGRQQPCWGSLFCTNLTQPTGALDQKTGHEVLELLKDINKSGKTVIIVTHDEGIAKMTDRIITISDGRIVGDSKER